MSDRAVIIYAADGHEELLDIALPTYKDFAHKHGYDVVVGEKVTDLPAAWNKISLLIEALHSYKEVVWFDSDLVIVNSSDDFPPMGQDKLHSMVRHFAWCSEVPNSGVWHLCRECGKLQAVDLLRRIWDLEVFRTHGWWEQAALMTLMGYTVPAEGSCFKDTKCKNVVKTVWYNSCQWMRLEWNSHPMYRADRPRIVHCSYESMPLRLETMRALVKDPHFNYPKYPENKPKDYEDEEENK